MDLFVIVKYKRLEKNQVSKIDQCSSQLVCEKLVRRVTLKRPCVKHMIESWRVMPSCQIHKYFARKAISQASRETLCLEKRKRVLPNSLPTLYIPWLPMKCKECFSERNISKYIWELEIVIPTIIYTFFLGFLLLLPLHLYIFERFLAQTFTTPNISVESS